MLLNERVLQPRIGTTTESREPDVVDEDHPVIIAGFGQFGSVIGRFLRGHGVDSTVLEFDSDHVDLLRKLGLKVFYGDAARHDLLEAAGAGRAKLLILAVGEHARTVEIVRAVQKHFPQLKILARAAGRWEAYELRDAGVEAVYRDTLDTALRLAVDALTTLGHRSYQMHRAAKTFRRHDEASVRTLGAMRHDAKQYFTAARQQIQDLEELLSAGAQDAERQDSGWDTESLIQEFGRTATGRSP
jgi:voltage-gated potassium channel Kch